MIHLVFTFANTFTLFPDTTLIEKILNKEFISLRNCIWSVTLKDYHLAQEISRELYRIEVDQSIPDEHSFENYPIPNHRWRMDWLTDWKQMKYTQYRIRHYRRNARLSVTHLTT